MSQPQKVIILPLIATVLRQRCLCHSSWSQTQRHGKENSTILGSIHIFPLIKWAALRIPHLITIDNFTTLYKNITSTILTSVNITQKVSNCSFISFTYNIRSISRWFHKFILNNLLIDLNWKQKHKKHITISEVKICSYPHGNLEKSKDEDKYTFKKLMSKPKFWGIGGILINLL